MPFSGFSCALIFAGQQPAAKRTEAGDSDARINGRRYGFPFQFPVNQAVDVLTGHHFFQVVLCGYALCLGQLPSKKHAGPRITNLTLPHEIVHGPQGFLKGRYRVGNMDMVKVDIIGLQPLEALFT